MSRKLLSQCNACVKCHDCWSDKFTVNFGVRQGSVMSLLLFNIYLNELTSLSDANHNVFIIVYADYILSKLIKDEEVEWAECLNPSQNPMMDLHPCGILSQYPVVTRHLPIRTSGEHQRSGPSG